MITKIERVNDNLVVISFDNRGDLNVVSDNGSAWSIVDKLISPRHDMTYTEYQSILSMEDEVTEIIAVEWAS